MNYTTVKIVKSTNPTAWYNKYIGKKIRVYGSDKPSISESFGRTYCTAIHNSSSIDVNDIEINT